jgi:hypothetical protein
MYWKKTWDVPATFCRRRCALSLVEVVGVVMDEGKSSEGCEKCSQKTRLTKTLSVIHGAM